MDIAQIDTFLPSNLRIFLSVVVTLQKRILVLNFIQKRFIRQDCGILVGANGMIDTVSRTFISLVLENGDIKE